MSTVTWSSYSFTICENSLQWNNVAGIYIFAGINSANQTIAYYVGQADSFRDRMSSHEKWELAQRLGATEIHALVVPEKAERDRIEAELIRMYKPVLNVQKK